MLFSDRPDQTFFPIPNQIHTPCNFQSFENQFSVGRILISVSYTHLDVYKRQARSYDLVYLWDTCSTISKCSDCLCTTNFVDLISACFFGSNQSGWIYFTVFPMFTTVGGMISS